MFTGQIGGGFWVERKQTRGNILKPLPTVAGDNTSAKSEISDQETKNFGHHNFFQGINDQN